MPDDLLQRLSSITTPPTPGAPLGIWGAFLLFLIPVGGGIPAGVLLARQSGVSPALMMFLYLVSDVVLAFVAEPLVRLILGLGRWIPILGRIGRGLARLFRQSTPRAGTVRGPMGIVLLSFSVDPITGRTTAAAAGHGFVFGWMLAIAGDMLYFALLMVSTLWLSGVLGDERLTIGVVLILTLVLPSLMRRRSSSEPAVPAQ
ncbi:MAG TPA: hypothetical protein VEI94_10635 [Candidatus Bathyarchaeia archaeon]|nr:hypothetical protein [Candidatus Bathyarchaeia archaeon]